MTIKTAPQPTREDILAFIAREQEAAGGPGKIGMREIARAFGDQGRRSHRAQAPDRRARADEGALEKRGKRVNRRGALPPVALVDIIARDRDGELIAAPVEWDADELGEPPRILIHAPRRARPGEPLPGVGDRALVRAEPDRDAGPGRAALCRARRQAALRARGIACSACCMSSRTATAASSPIDKKQAGRELLVAAADIGEAKDGDLVSVDLVGKTPLRRAARPRARDAGLGDERKGRQPHRPARA